jgi:hypothetical protein
LFETANFKGALIEFSLDLGAPFRNALDFCLQLFLYWYQSFAVRLIALTPPSLLSAPLESGIVNSDIHWPNHHTDVADAQGELLFSVKGRPGKTIQELMIHDPRSRKPP